MLNAWPRFLTPGPGPTKFEIVVGDPSAKKQRLAKTAFCWSPSKMNYFLFESRKFRSVPLLPFRGLTGPTHGAAAQRLRELLRTLGQARELAEAGHACRAWGPRGAQCVCGGGGGGAATRGGRGGG